MATLTFRPNGEGIDINWIASGDPSDDNYTKVDEVTADEDTTYNSRSNGGGPNAKDTFLWALSGIDSGDTINHVTVHIRARETKAGAEDIAAVLELDASYRVGSTHVLTGSYDDYSYQFDDAPGGTGWSFSDLANLEFGYENVGDDSLGPVVRCTQVYMVIDYTVPVSNHPKPTGLLAEGVATPTDASELPSFSALFQATGDSGSATAAYIEMAEDNLFVTKIAESGWITIAATADNVRCPDLFYNVNGVGSWTSAGYLSSAPPNGNYFWRIKFRDGSSVESVWSDDGATDPSELSGFTRQWAIDGADNRWNYAHRRRLFWDITTNDNGVSADYVGEFSLQTGNREIVATSVKFNEAVQASGGFQVARFGGKTYFAWLDRFDPDLVNMTIKIAALDHTTGVWSDAVFVRAAGSSLDTHHFPVLDVDDDGYIHIAYGCHYSPLRYVRSENPEDISSWIRPSDNSPTLYDTLSNEATYPILMTVDGVTYCFWREGTSASSEEYFFKKTTDNGQNWSVPYQIIDDTFNDDSNNKFFRVYLYGLRYDVKTGRLHISWTYNHIYESANDYETGIWYAYSDLDETDGSSLNVGFNIWREADGTLYGYTDSAASSLAMIGTNNLLNWDAEIGRAIVFHSTDVDEQAVLQKIFTETLAIDVNGNPVVFFEAKFRTNSVTDETYLACAIWTGSVWTIIDIALQINRMLRVRRSSIGIMTDRDGILRMFMPVNSLTFHHFLPEADHDETNVTRSTGLNNYALLDDGLAVIDTTTYVDVGATTGKLSVSNSTIVIPEGAVIQSVEITLTYIVTGGGTNGVLYLDVGGTEYDSGSIPFTPSDYEEITKEWTTNPDTAAAWLASAVEGLQFGIKITGSNTLRCIRIVERVKYLSAQDDEWNATEIMEVKSVDNGVNWTLVGPVSGSSGIGIPIMNHKHHTTNLTVEIVWTSGNDLFYLTDNPFGLMRQDGNDVRLYYGDNEIDRLMDYANLNPTIFHFKVPDAVVANQIAGDKDLQLYTGNPNEVTQPMSDPNGVLIYFEGFEGLDDNSNLSGVGGWTVNSGTWTVYTSPPNHANKVYGGNGVAEAAADGAEMEQTIGSDLTEIYIEAAFWHEAGLGKSSIGVVDSSGDTFGVGYDGGIAKQNAFYDDNGTDVESEFVMNGQIYNDVIIRINSDGCSAWINGEQIIRNLSGITSVDKIVLKAGGQAYFDHIRILQRIAIDPSASVSITDPLMSLDSDVTSTYESATDGLYESTSSTLNQVKVEIGGRVSAGDTDSGTLKFRLHYCPEATYNASNITDLKDIIMVGINTDTFTFKSVLFDVTTAGCSVKVDFYDDAPSSTHFFDGKINSVIEFETNPGEPQLDIQAVEANGMTMSAVLKGKGDDAFTMDAEIGDVKMTRPGKLPGDFGVGLSVLKKVTTSSLAALIAARSIATEFKGYVTRLFNIPAAFGSGLTANGAPVIGYSGSLSIFKRVPVDVREGFTVSRHGLAEHTGGVTVSRTVPAGTGLTFSAFARLMPVEFIMVLNASKEVPIEYPGGFTADKITPAEYGSTLDVIVKAVAAGLGSGIALDLSCPAEYGIRIDTIRHLVVEHLGSVILNKFSSMPSEFLTAEIILKSLPSEYATGLAEFARSMPVEFASVVQAVRNIPAENRAGIDINKRLPEEFGETIQPIEKSMLIEFGLSVVLSRIATVEFMAGLFRSGEMPIEFTGGEILSILGRMPVDFVSGVEVARIMNAETLVALSREFGSRTEFGISLERRTSLTVETLAVLESSHQVLTEWTGALSASFELNVETNALLSHTARLHIDYGMGFTARATVPVDILVSLIRRANIPAEWSGIAFSAVILTGVRLKTPKLDSVQLKPSELNSLRVIMSQLEDARLDTTDLSGLVLKVAKIINSRLRGGNDG